MLAGPAIATPGGPWAPSTWSISTLRRRRVWLRGATSGRWAVWLTFAPPGQSFDDSVLPGTGDHRRPALLSGRGPAPGARRASVTEDDPDPLMDAGRISGRRRGGSSPSWSPPIRGRAGCRWRCSDGPSAATTAGGCEDATGTGCPLLELDGQPWPLLAQSGGEPLTVFGEWNGSGLRPLSVLPDDQRPDPEHGDLRMTRAGRTLVTHRPARHRSASAAHRPSRRVGAAAVDRARPTRPCGLLDLAARHRAASRVGHADPGGRLPRRRLPPRSAVDRSSVRRRRRPSEVLGGSLVQPRAGADQLLAGLCRRPRAAVFRLGTGPGWPAWRPTPPPTTGRCSGRVLGERGRWFLRQNPDWRRLAADADACRSGTLRDHRAPRPAPAATDGRDGPRATEVDLRPSRPVAHRPGRGRVRGARQRRRSVGQPASSPPASGPGCPFALYASLGAGRRVLPAGARGVPGSAPADPGGLRDHGRGGVRAGCASSVRSRSGRGQRARLRRVEIPGV